MRISNAMKTLTLIAKNPFIIKTFVLINFVFYLSFGFSQTDYYVWSDNNLNNSAPSFKSGTQIATDEFGKVYYIANDGRVCYYYLIGNDWHVGVLSLSSPAQRAKRFTGLEYRNYSLFYVNESGDVSRFYYYNNSWIHEVLNTTAPKVMSGSQLATDEFGKVYYIANDGRVCYYYLIGNDWHVGVLSLSSPAQRAKRFTGLEYRNYSLFYVNESGNVSRFYYYNNSWIHEVLNTSSLFNVMVGTQLATDEFGKVYFTNEKGVVCTSYQIGGEWHCDWLKENAIKAKAWTGLFYFDKQLFFVGIDNKLYAYYYNDCNWEITNSLNDTCFSASYSSIAISNNASHYNNLYYMNSNDNKLHVLKSLIPNNYTYVYLKGKKFIRNSSEMNLRIMNYSVDVNTNDYVNYWVSQNISYNNQPENRNCNDKEACLMQLRQDFIDIKNLGFTAIRLVGGLAIKPSYNSKDLNFCISAITSDPAYDYTDILLNENLENKLFSMIFEILNEANNAGLKVILLTGKAGNTTTTFHDLYGDYLGRLAKKLKNNTTLMAYDLYNEPANMSLSKEIICNSVNNWYTIIKTNDPNHMVTIGLQNALDVFSWDPGLLSVDFLSFHLYPFPSTNDTHLIFDPRKRVFSDIKWISNIANKINKPWIIGETGFAADLDGSPNTNDWGTEMDQDNYARAIIKRSGNCGSSGFSWWQYHDVYWESPTQDYLGFYSHDNIGKKIVKNQTINNYNPDKQCNCPQPANYYNYFNFSQYCYSGTVIDELGNPIADAVIYGWGRNWIGGSKTYSKRDGTFTVFSNVPLFHLSVTSVNKDIISRHGNDGGNIPLSSNQGMFSLPSIGCGPFSLKGAEGVDFNIVDLENEPNDYNNDNKETCKISVFPNPVRNDLYVSSDIIIKNIALFDFWGRSILNYRLESNSITIDCSNLSSGLYFIIIETDLFQKREKIHIFK